MKKITSYNSIGILVFEISSIEFGCEMDKIRLLNPSRKYIIRNGKIEFERENIVLFDLAVPFLLDSKIPLKKKNALLYEYHEMLYGLLIDNVKEVLNLDQKCMKRFKRINNDIQNQLLIGELLFEGRRILFPNLEAILDREYAVIK